MRLLRNSTPAVNEELYALLTTPFRDDRILPGIELSLTYVRGRNLDWRTRKYCVWSLFSISSSSF